MFFVISLNNVGTYSREPVYAGKEFTFCQRALINNIKNNPAVHFNVELVEGLRKLNKRKPAHTEKQQ